MNDFIYQPLKANLNLTFNELQIEQTNSNDVTEFLLSHEIQKLEEMLLEILQVTNEQRQHFYTKWNEFMQIGKNILLGCKKKELTQLISLIQQFFPNKINEEQICQVIQRWQNFRLNVSQVLQIFNEQDLKSLIKIPQIINYIQKIAFQDRISNQYDFFNNLVYEIIQDDLKMKKTKQEKDFESIKCIFDNLELKAINLIINKNNSQCFQELSPQNIFKHQQILHFFIARYFDGWLTTICPDQISNQNDKFLTIRDSSKIREMQFIASQFAGVVELLKGKYKSVEVQQLRLIKMVKASAFIDNFEQEGGNAMCILSSLQLIIRNENFMKISLINSSMNNIQFFSCNFDESVMDNVSIVSAQFIECQLSNLYWQNLESSLLTILKGEQIIFSAHRSILIFITEDRNYREKRRYDLRYINLHTGKQLKVSYKQFSFEGYIKQSLKLSCLEQVLVFNDKKQTIFLNSQCNKKLRVNKIRGQLEKYGLSHDCQTLASYNSKGGYINLWRIYHMNRNLQVQAQNIDQIKFSQNDKILIMKAKDFNYFFDIQNELEINTIKNNGDIYKFSSNVYHYAIQENQCLQLRSLNNEKKLQLLEGLQKIENQYKLKFSPDGKILVYFGARLALIWAIDTEQIISSFHFPSEDQVEQIKLSPDGQTLAFIQNKILFLWNFNQGQQFHILQADLAEIYRLHFSSNGKYLILEGINTRCWNLKNLNFNQLLKNPDSVLFSSSNSSHLSFIYGRKILIKTLNDMKGIYELDLNKENKTITTFALSPDFFKITYYYDSNIFIRNIQNGKQKEHQKLDLQNLKYRIEGKYLKMKFSPDGEYLLIFQLLEPSHILLICNILEQRIIFDKFSSNSSIDEFEFSLDSQFVTVSSDSNVEILNLQSKNLKRLETLGFGSFQNPKIFAFSFDSQYLASCNENYLIYLWNINGEKLLQKLKGHTQKITKMAFFNEDMIMISGSLDGKLIIWNISDCEQLQVLNQNGFGIISLSISLDRSRIVTMDDYGTIYFWGNMQTEYDNNNINKQNEKGSKFIKNQKFDKKYFSLYQILGSPKFRTQNCQIRGSKFSSTEGFNLRCVFTRNTGLNNEGEAC